MPLDLTELSRQVRAMSSALQRNAPDLAQRRAQALERYLREAPAHATWAQAADLSREGSAWLLARRTGSNALPRLDCRRGVSLDLDPRRRARPAAGPLDD